MARFENIIKWTISCSQGKFDLRGIVDYDVGHDRKVETVNEVGRKHPGGFVIKPGGHTIGFTRKIVRGEKLDLRKLMVDEEIFELVGRYEGGKAVQFPEVMVSNLPSSGDGDGKNEEKVEFVSLQGLPL